MISTPPDIPADRAVFPAAVAAVPVTAMEGKNALASAETVAFTTLLSVVTVPVFAAILMGYYL